jgi:hypothetical protein
MNAELVDLPGFRAETDALLDRFAAADTPEDSDPYAALLRDRFEPPDPALAGVCDPAARPA